MQLGLNSKWKIEGGLEQLGFVLYKELKGLRMCVVLDLKNFIRIKAHLVLFFLNVRTLCPLVIVLFTGIPFFGKEVD